jgi:hypothetical protein
MADSRNQAGAGERYIQQYPRYAKWINQCVQCQARGYKPDMPTEMYGSIHRGPRGPEKYFYRNILLRYFKPLPLDERGLCDICAAR